MPILEKLKKKLSTPGSPDSSADSVSEEMQYTHGFEKIYAIETLDTSTIRPMGSVQASPDSASNQSEKSIAVAPLTSTPELDLPTPVVKDVNEVINQRISSANTTVSPTSIPDKEVFIFSQKEQEKQVDDFQKPEAISQMEFDFGQGFRHWLPSAVLEQPIQTLELSPLAYRALDHKGMRFIGDLLDKHGQVYGRFEGLGQGHIDEIRSKVAQLTCGRELIYNFQLEPESWVQSLFADSDKVGAYLYLKPFSLETLIKLNKEQEVSVKHLFDDQKKQHVQAIDHMLSHSEKKSYIEKKIKEVFSAFILPWVQQRGGLVKSYEVKERWLNISNKRLLAGRLWDFLEKVYFSEQDIYGLSLLCIEKGKVYAIDKLALKNYRLIMKIVSSYFYTPEVTYELNDLVRLIGRESSWYWKKFPEGFVEKAILFSGELQKSRSTKGDLMIQKKQ